jgi:hypothetical protein
VTQAHAQSQRRKSATFWLLRLPGGSEWTWKAQGVASSAAWTPTKICMSRQSSMNRIVFLEPDASLQPARDIGRFLIERALRLFEEMKATGWIEEARGALATASPV